MKQSLKTEIVIPTWDGRTGPGYWGDQDYTGYENRSTSFGVLFRGVVAGESHSSMNTYCRAIGDIGLYVYVSLDATVSIDLRLHDAGSLTLMDSVQRVKVLKRLFVKGKGYRFSDFARETDVFTELTKALAALGIKRGMAYHGINEAETFEPGGIVIKRISDCVQERLDRMRQRQVA
ncbi:MAG: hypothetical protein PHQ58_23405 [Rhodoferax sp.]|uniref:hypothetical protein n=1 Tax=Rhodoferax sp. TaxID=50421 RepID=UPI0026205209|nr:hypothetical protein [Rhodoferax sp.]MDD2883368.1 hypothetical protein [Rhodoferax sp.]